MRNRLDNVHHGERVLFPEIPCSFDADWSSVVKYQDCVSGALAELVGQGVIDHEQEGRFFASAVQAFFDEQQP